MRLNLFRWLNIHRRANGDLFFSTWQLRTEEEEEEEEEEEAEGDGGGG